MSTLFINSLVLSRISRDKCIMTFAHTKMSFEALFTLETTQIPINSKPKFEDVHIMEYYTAIINDSHIYQHG